MAAIKRKQRGRGKPFVAGDSRINRDHGPKCADAAAWSMNGINALARKLSPDEWADIVARKARAGVQWALELYRDVFIEKPAQRHEHSGRDGGPIILRAIWGNGNGNDK